MTWKRSCITRPRRFGSRRCSLWPIMPERMGSCGAASAGMRRPRCRTGSPGEDSRRVRRWRPARPSSRGSAGRARSGSSNNRHSRMARKSVAGGRRWVPVCTGTTGGGGRTHNRHSRDGGNPRWGAGDGFPSARERRAAAAHPQSSFPRRRESAGGAGDGFPSARERRAEAGAPTIGIRGGGRRWVPVCTNNGGKIRGGGPAMGSRLHGNDGRRRAHPQSSFPRRRESDGGNPRGGRRWVPVCTGTTGGDRRTHNRHSRDGGNPGLGVPG